MKEPGNLEIVKLPIDSLTPYKRNAKKHPPEQVEQIKESIRLYGNNDPIAVWGKKNMIVEGHGRFLALKELGYTEVDCVRLDHLTAQERREYTLVHNQTTMNSGFDIPTLKLELAELPKFDVKGFGFDFSLPGYPDSPPEDLEPYRPEPEPQEDRDGPVTTSRGGGTEQKDKRREDLYYSDYSMKPGEVHYEPKETHHAAKDLFSMTGKFNEMISEIENDDLKMLFRLRAAWFCEFDFSKIADYYAYQASPEEQRVFEALGLVLLDKDNLIKNGFSKLIETVDSNDDYE